MCFAMSAAARAYNRETLSVMYKGKSIADLLDTTVEEALPLLENIPQIKPKLQTLARRRAWATSNLASRRPRSRAVKRSESNWRRNFPSAPPGERSYILDEPTTGLHFADVHKLLDVLQRLVSVGNTVIVIEHNLDVIKNADFIIRPWSGRRRPGGRIVASGTPEEVAAVKRSHTGNVLKPLLNGNGKRNGGRNGSAPI